MYSRVSTMTTSSFLILQHGSMFWGFLTLNQVSGHYPCQKSTIHVLSCQAQPALKHSFLQAQKF